MHGKQKLVRFCCAFLCKAAACSVCEVIRERKAICVVGILCEGCDLCYLFCTDGYLLCIGTCKYKCAVAESTHEFSGEIEVQGFDSKFGIVQYVVPVFFNVNDTLGLGKINFVVNAVAKALDSDGSVCMVHIQIDICINDHGIVLNGLIKDFVAPSLVCVHIAKEELIGFKVGIERLSCLVQFELVVAQDVAILNLDSFTAFNNLAINSGDNRNSVVDDALNVCLNNNVLFRHLGQVLAGCFIHPAVEVCAKARCVIKHLVQIGACGQESGENRITNFILIGYAVEVAYANGNVKAGGYVSAIVNDDVKEFLNVLSCALKTSGVRSEKIECLVDTLFEQSLCIKGYALFKYECRVATIEVHQAVVSDNCAESGSHQAVNDLEGASLNGIVESAAGFYLINYCGVEVCERIGRSCCLLEQIVQIEIYAKSVSELVDNVINGVIEVTVNLCGQTVGDLKAGNAFELFYKYLKGRNFCDCIDQVLCFEVVRKVIAGLFLNVRQENLCIARSENLVVNLTEDCGVDCIENSNDFFNGQAFCKCDEVAGSLVVNSQNLILKCVELRIVGICHLFEGNTENACKLGRNLNICNELAVSKADGANLIHKDCKLARSLADGVGACGQNKVEVESLGLDSIAIAVRDREACGKQLAAVINVRKLGKSGNEVFKCIYQLTGEQLDVFAILLGNNNAVDFDLCDVVHNRREDGEQRNDVRLKVERTDDLLNSTGLVNNGCSLLEIHLANECGHTNSLNHSHYVKDIGDLAVGHNVVCNGIDIKGSDERTDIGYVSIDQSLVAAGCVDSNINTDSADCCCVVGLVVNLLEAIDDILRGDLIACKNLALDHVDLNHILILVTCITESLNGDNLCLDELVNVDDTIVDQVVNVDNILVDQISEIGEQRIQICICITEQQNLNVECCGQALVAVEQFIVPRLQNTCLDHCLDIEVYTVKVKRDLNVVKCALIFCFYKDFFCLLYVHIVVDLILNINKQTGKNVGVCVCGQACGEAVVVTVNELIKLAAVYTVGQSIDFNVFDVVHICSTCKVNTVQGNSCVDVDDGEQSILIESQCHIHQLIGVSVDEILGLDQTDSTLNVVLIYVTHQGFKILNVVLQIGQVGKELYQTFFVSTSQQLVNTNSGNKHLNVDIGNNGLYQVKNSILGNDCG